jgi:hypothetical protein
VSSLKNSQRPHADSPDLRILKIGPKEQPFGSGYDTSIRRWAMRPTELVSASRVAILENAEAARQLLLGQPTNTGAVRRLLACIVKDGLRTGDIVRRTRALIEKAQLGPGSSVFGIRRNISVILIELNDDEFVKPIG